MAENQASKASLFNRRGALFRRGDTASYGGPVTVLLSIALSGCSMFLPSANSAIPNAGRDPTPLGKCSVAASQARPLVTEWPASEKSRLEALLARGSVAVAYSGCEMKIVESCRLGGGYGFQRTTSATDQVEIQNDDELYGKLPLGAVRLEGDLRRTGRLAVRTTVVGQFMLAGEDLNRASSDPSCDEATHIVSGMSVGAFKLLAGGKVSASAGASVGGLGAGTGGAREEVTLTQAGDEASCAEAGSLAPDRCRSPIQLFLQKLRRADLPGGERPSSTASLTEAKLLEGNERWVLMRGADTLCTLPCRTWIEPSQNNYKLVGPDAKLDLKTRPDWTGKNVHIEVTPSRGSWTGVAVIGGAGGLVGMIMMVGGFAGNSSSAAQTSSERDAAWDRQVAWSLAGFGVWVAGGIGAGAYYWFHKRDAAFSAVAVDRRTSSIRLQPGALSWKGPGDLSATVSPIGLWGQF